MFFAPVRKPLIRRADNPVRQTAAFHAVPPIAVDAQRLKVNAAAVQLLNALHVEGAAPGLASEFRIRNDRLHLIHGCVRMDIDYPNTPSTDLDLAACNRACGLRYLTGS